MPVLFRDVRLPERDAGEGTTLSVNPLVENRPIAALGAPPAQQGRIVEGRGDLPIPGPINGHGRAFVNPMEGRRACLPLALFKLGESPAFKRVRPTQGQAYLRTMLGCIATLRHGATAGMAVCPFLPEPTEKIIDAVAQACADSGMRIALAREEPELSKIGKRPFLDDPEPAEIGEKLAHQPGLRGADLLALYDHLIARWHGAGDGRIGAAFVCSAPLRVAPWSFAALDAMSRAHELALGVHRLETKHQRVFGDARMGGRSMVKCARDLGPLSDRKQVVQANRVDADDLDPVATAGANVAHNPTSDPRRGSGAGPMRELPDRGISRALGAGETFAGDRLNIWSVTKAAALAPTRAGVARPLRPSARDGHRAGTRGGGCAKRRPGWGSMELGAPADLILVDLSPRACPPINDLARQLGHVENNSAVRPTLAAGCVVAKNGRVTAVDKAALPAKAREVFAALAPVPRGAANAILAPLPANLAMHKRAVAGDIGRTHMFRQGLS